MEDQVGPYNQSNYYSGGNTLVSPSGFNWTTATDPVSVLLDHVAGARLGGLDGKPTSIPSSINSGGIHTHNYTYIP